MDDVQSAELVGGGDCSHLHYHTSDKEPSIDTLRRLQQLETVITVTAALNMQTDTTTKNGRNADVVRCNPAAPFTVTLPTSKGSGRRITIYRIAAQTITVAVQTGNTLNGTLNGTTTITASYTPRTFKDVLTGATTSAWEDV